MAQDVQILPFDTKNAPNSWVIPDALKIMVKAIEATFDGSGAGSAFLPAVEILSDSGHSVGIFPTDSTVAAGGSAEVTFAPFLRNAAGASGASTLAEWVGIEQHSTSQTMLPFPDASYLQEVDWTGGRWRTSAPGTFSWQAGLPTQVSIGDNAVSYLLTVNAIVNVDIVASGGLAPYRLDAPGTFDPNGLAVEIVCDDAMPQLNGNQNALDGARAVTYLWGNAFTGALQPTRAIYAVSWVGAIDATATWPIALQVRLAYWSKAVTGAVATAFVVRIGATPNTDGSTTVSPLV